MPKRALLCCAEGAKKISIVTHLQTYSNAFLPPPIAAETLPPPIGYDPDPPLYHPTPRPCMPGTHKVNM